MKKYNILLQQCMLTTLVCYPSITLATVLDQQREQSVLSIRSGEIDTGIEQLKKLLEQHPDHQKLIADYIVSAYSHKKLSDSDLSYIKNIRPTQYPEYGQISLIKGLRDLKQYNLAEYWVRQFNSIKPQDSWTVWTGLLQAEAGEKTKAQETLKNINLNHLSADTLSLLAYTYRILDMPLESLETAEKSVKTHTNADNLEQLSLALIEMSDFETAERILKNLPDISAEKKTQLLHTIQLNAFSQHINQGIQYYQNNNSRNPNAYAVLDQVLKDMERYAPKLENFPDLKKRFQFDYLYALNARNLPRKVITERTKLNMNEAEMPVYIQVVLAESYLKTEQARKAELLYKNVLNEPKFQDFSHYSGLYYSLLAQEKFAEANQLIQHMEQTLPKFRYSQAKGVDREPHPDWNQFISLKGLNYAYRNENQKAEQYFQELVAQAPNNLTYQNNLALIQRWREKPELAQRTLSVWNGLIDDELGVQLSQMQNAQALTDIATWRSESHRLEKLLAEDSGFQKSRQELNDRNRVSITHQSSFSESKADNPALLGQLKGSKEQSNNTRLNSPWFADNFRVFADHQYRWSEYDAGKLNEQRFGFGVEWQKDRKFANLLWSQDDDGNRSGIQFNWSQWLNDHWNYSLGYASQANIPLQAVRLNHKGKAYHAGLNWQANESRKAGLNYQLTDIDDGNTRHELGTYFKQRLYASPHHLTDATLRGYFSQNKEIDVPYFNPKHSHSVELTLEHDWITWRNYQRSFNQHFEATVGLFGQTDHSDKPIYNVLYQHEWQLSRTWKLNYGVGWGSHAYDGEDEKKTYAIVGFEGKF